MSMSKQDFIALADEINDHNRTAKQLPERYTPFTPDQLKTLAHFCAKQNSRFMRERWFAYIAGECGPNGGKVRAA